MNESCKNLSVIIQKFLSQGEKTLQIAEKEPSALKATDLTLLADRIQAMHRSAISLLQDSVDEMSWYNASIIKELLDEPLKIDGRKKEISLLQAAQEAKHNDTSLRLLLRAWIIESNLKEVLFENLEQISSELSA